MLVTFSLLDPIPGAHNLKELFNLAQGFRGLSQWSAGSKAGTSWLKGEVEHRCLVHGDQEGEQENSSREEGN